ncbi:MULTISPECIES: NRAMP family divalent metal transporter [Thioclava]|uniref:NRAMP family divalent metal transporter n=1 Tax=Thioclava kandeliae TaxID=3070818 RepID=A0ABV1SL56_9RHOB
MSDQIQPARLKRHALVAAIFMMATSAIGPGFITQTATFTGKLGATFAFAILVSILIDFVVQMNIWRIITLSRRRAAEIANAALPGTGYLLAVFILLGGFVFNVGNIAGAGLGTNALLGLDPKTGGVISALIAVGIFLSKRAGLVMDRVVVVLGLVMLALVVFVACVSHPPVGEALRQTIFPDSIDFATIVTIVGGTIGGYITYAGAHRLLDQGMVGEENLPLVTRAALTGIVVTGVMRFVLFLAILGVVSAGLVIDTSGQSGNPAAQAFRAAAGDLGLRVFGAILWGAAITSVIGAAYTSVSFLTVFLPRLSERGRAVATVVFIALSLATYIGLGTAPAALLVFAGGFNGLILPVGFSVFMYVGWARPDLLGGYRSPRWLLVSGTLVCVLTWYMGLKSVGAIFAFLGQ